MTKREYSKKNRPQIKQKTRSHRGERARANLVKCAKKVMEKVGYHEMKISDITTEAGVAIGLFYHYFTDLKSITIEVLENHIGENLNLKYIERNVPRGDWYERIRSHTWLRVNSYATQPGVMRSLLQMVDEDEDFSIIVRENLMQQLNWLIEKIPKIFPNTKISKHQALMTIYVLSSSSDAFLHRYYIEHDSKLYKNNLTIDEITELLSVMFYRGLFLENPDANKLNYTTPLLNMKLNLKDNNKV